MRSADGQLRMDSKKRLAINSPDWGLAISIISSSIFVAILFVLWKNVKAIKPILQKFLTTSSLENEERLQ